VAEVKWDKLENCAYTRFLTKSTQFLRIFEGKSEFFHLNLVGFLARKTQLTKVFAGKTKIRKVKKNCD